MTTSKNARQWTFRKFQAEPRNVARLLLVSPWDFGKSQLWVREGEKMRRASRRRVRREYLNMNERPEFYDWTLKRQNGKQYKHEYQQSWIGLRDTGKLVNADAARNLHAQYRRKKRGWR